MLRSWKLTTKIASILVLGSMLALGTVTLTPEKAYSSDFRSSIGTEFWLTFDMNSSDHRTKNAFTPQIILSAVRDSKVTITWPDGTSENVDVSAGTVEVVDATSKVYTADAYNIFVNNGSTSTDNSTVGVKVTGVKVESDWPISVYTTNLDNNQSGASVAYPTSFLGTRYRLIGVDIADVLTDPCRIQTRYSILATEDGTTVTVTPSTNYEVLDTPSSAVFTKTLDAGESFTAGSTGYYCWFAKFSGTLIEADKKIVVKTSGSLNTKTPEALAFDFVTEFLPPVSTWGKNFILPTNDELSLEPSQFFIVTDEASTISVNGGAGVNLAAGATHIVTGSNSSPFADTLVSDKPILVMQIFGGVDYNDATAFPLSIDRVDGDNEIVMITPNEQFLNDFIFTTAGINNQFRHHRITVVARTSDVANIELDGNAINTNEFSQVGSSDFSVARLPITEGSHRVKSEAGFAVYVYGYGDRDSYSYSAGTGLVDTIANPGGTGDTGFRSLELISGLVSNSAPAPAAPAPYTGPLVTSVGSQQSAGAFQTTSSATVTVYGERLSGVNKVFIEGKEAVITSTSNDSFFMTLPEGLADGVHDLVIQSSLGNLTYLDGISIAGETVQITSYGEVSAWTKRISDSQVKVYVKYPTVGERVRIGHQTGGSGDYNTVYVKTTVSENDESMIVNEHGSYIVRTIDLEQINRIRVTVGDQTLVQVRYNN